MVREIKLQYFPATLSLSLNCRSGFSFPDPIPQGTISIEYTEYHAPYQTALQTSYIAACDSVKAVRV